MTSVVVTGVGALGSFGQGAKSLRDALQIGNNKFTQIQLPELGFSTVLAPLSNFDFEQSLNQLNLPPAIKLRAEKSGRKSPITVQASLISMLEAWQQAHFIERTFNPERVGVLIAGNNTTQGYNYRVQQNLDDLSYLSPSYSLHFMDTHQIGVITEVLNISGESFTVGSASASGNVALIQGARLLQQGILDVCLVIGAMADLSPLEIQAFYNIGALGGKKFKDKPLQACRPFDQEHEGFILGQASGCIILELFNEEIPALGYFKGSGFVLDANQGTEPNVRGEAKAMQQALKQANMLPSQIDYINTHGSSSPLGDNTEAAAIASAFSECLDKIWLNATKSIIGHCLWSAGILEAIATLLQFNEGFLHPNVNLINPIYRRCRFVGETPIPVDLKTALSNSFGFGGINTSIIFAKGNANGHWY